MTRRYLLDTDTVSYFIKASNRPVVARILETSPQATCVSVMTAAELLFGLKKNPAATALHQKVRSFLKTAPVLDWDGAAAEAYADIGAILAGRKQQIGEIDTMIAAHALSLGLILVTNNNRHFSRVPGLKLENWAT